MFILGQSAIQRLKGMIPNQPNVNPLRNALDTLGTLLVCNGGTDDPNNPGQALTPQQEAESVAPVKGVGILVQGWFGGSGNILYTNSNTDLVNIPLATSAFTPVSYSNNPIVVPVAMLTILSLTYTVSGAYAQYRGAGDPNVVATRKEQGLLYWQTNTGRLFIYDSYIGRYRLLTSGGTGATIPDYVPNATYQEGDLVYWDRSPRDQDSGIYRYTGSFVAWTRIAPAQFNNNVALTVPPDGYFYVPQGQQFAGVYRNMDSNSSITVHNYGEIATELSYGKLLDVTGDIKVWTTNTPYSAGDKVFYPSVNYSVFFVCTSPRDVTDPPPGSANASGWLLLANKGGGGGLATVKTAAPIIGNGSTASPIRFDPPTNPVVGYEYVQRCKAEDDPNNPGSIIFTYYWSRVV